MAIKITILKAQNDKFGGSSRYDNRIYGNDGNDTLTGGKGADTLDGGNGNDILSGDADKDVLIGGAGNDILDGGRNKDVLTGGAGNDTFILNRATPDMDTITDFSVADDTIQLAKSEFSVFTTTGTPNADFLKIGTAATDSNDHLIYNNNTGMLYYDFDGNGSLGQYQIATLGKQLALTTADFVIV